MYAGPAVMNGAASATTRLPTNFKKPADPAGDKKTAETAPPPPQDCTGWPVQYDAWAHNPLDKRYVSQPQKTGQRRTYVAAATPPPDPADWPKTPSRNKAPYRRTRTAGIARYSGCSAHRKPIVIPFILTGKTMARGSRIARRTTAL